MYACTLLYPSLYLNLYLSIYIYIFFLCEHFARPAAKMSWAQTQQDFFFLCGTQAHPSAKTHDTTGFGFSREETSPT